VTVRYAKGPVVFLRDPADRSKKKKQLLWGDWVRVIRDLGDGFAEVRWGAQEVFVIANEDLQDERVCEFIFLDVGQGDGCILTTPGPAGEPERILIIDAGDGDNMERYLNWRFRDFRTAFRFHAAVITHPDRDHYLGFQGIFDNPQVSFDKVYHNGILERTGDDLLGPQDPKFLTDIRATHDEAHALYADEAVRGRKLYPKLLWTALNDAERFGEVAMLSTHSDQLEGGRSYVPGFAPSDSQDFTIEVLGPVVEPAADGAFRLRRLGDDGKTKNGHSVLLKLRYHKLSVLFGGDLNKPAEEFLLEHYGDEARERFGVDLMKCCHHGSADVTSEFLEACSPAAFIVSSGDEEGHVHPRPDLLGLLGKKGRGERPLLLCTELQRSTREREDPKPRRDLDRIEERLDALAPGSEEREALAKEREDLLDKIFKRNVGVYGAINVRTDGKRAVVAFRKESPKDTSRWFFYELTPDASGSFAVVPRAGG
jgi:beta-lactamase superfamily II metal-dependent hydrolase